MEQSTDTPSSSGEAPKILYHYTTFAGAKGIGETRTIWATSIRHLNDSREYAHAFRVVRDAFTHRAMLWKDKSDFVTRVLDSFVSYLDTGSTGIHPLLFLGPPPTTYVISLSAEGDQLSQWRAYSQGNGYALGFRTSALRTIGEEQGFRLIKCNYDPQDQLNRALAIADNVIDALKAEPQDSDDRVRLLADINLALANELRSIAPAWKQSGFSEENEWRLVYQPTGDCEVRFRTGRTAIIPYIELHLDTPSAPRGGPDGHIEVLEEFVVGPSPEPALAMSTLKYLLNVKGLACPACGFSSVPYRHW